MSRRQQSTQRDGVRRYRHGSQFSKTRKSGVRNHSPLYIRGDDFLTRRRRGEYRRRNRIEPINPDVPGFGIALKTLIKGVKELKKGKIKDSLRLQTTALAAFLALASPLAPPPGIDRRFVPIPERTYDPHLLSWRSDWEDVGKWRADKSFRQSQDPRVERRERHVRDKEDEKEDKREKTRDKKREKKKTLKNKLNKRNAAPTT